MYAYIFLFIFLKGVLAGVNFYDTFTGKPITNEEYKKRLDENMTSWCTGKYLSCDVNEGRRLDGSCNNLKTPTRGPGQTPYASLLPLVFDNGNNPKKTKSGKELEYRKLREDTLTEGTIPDQVFTILAVHYLRFAIACVASFHDTDSFIVKNTNCCQPEGKHNAECYPMKVRNDDKVHQFSDIRCFNNTRPVTFQSEGCTRHKNSTSQRINLGNSFLDLSNIYGTDGSLRSFQDGLLKVETENNQIWPESINADGTCLLNELPRETRCHKQRSMNTLFGLNLFGIIHWRYHNYIARRLKEVNSCWDDEKLFTVARDIHIAIFVQIYYYELMPLLLGEPYMYSKRLLVRDNDFRDPYNENMSPQQLLEYIYVLRWGHTIQPGNLEMFDTEGHYLKKIPIVNMTLRTGFLPLDKNMEGFVQGCFRQPAAKFDHVVDPVLTQNGLVKVQRAFDIVAADLMKGGLFGLQSYIAYRKVCSGKSYNTFDDLSRDMDPEYIEVLKDSYEDVSDVPLLAGIWLERKIEGGAVPKTFACLMGKQLKRFMQYDRHWYERPNRPNAFTKQQLKEIRKASIAQILCAVEDSVTSITPNPFLRIGPGNQVISCDNLITIDFGAWADPSCGV